ncbi:MAG: glycosyltransferase family 39 protein [Candidatus Omnitrophota bacterium]
MSTIKSMVYGGDAGMSRKGVWDVHFLVIVGIALFLRFFHLTRLDLWFDEAITCRVIQRDLPGVPGFPYLYYGFMNFWTSCFGVSVFSLRLPSVLFDVAALGILYKLGRLLFPEKKITWGAAWLFAVSPMHVWYSQDATVYAMSSCAVLAALYLFFSWRAHRQIRFAVTFLLAAVLAAGIDYLSLCVTVPLAAYLVGCLYRRFSLPGRLACLSVITVAAAGLCLWGAGVLSKDLSSVGWIPKPDMNAVYGGIASLLTGYFFTQSGNQWAIAAMFVVAGLCVPLLVQRKQMSLFLIVLAPLAGMLLFSYLFFPAFLGRKLMIVSGVWYLLVAAAFFNLKKHLVARLAAVGLIILIAQSLVIYYRGPSNYEEAYQSHLYHRGVFYKYPSQPLLRYVRARAMPGDALLYSNTDMEYVLAHYLSLMRWDIPHYHVYSLRVLLRDDFEKMRVLNMFWHNLREMRTVFLRYGALSERFLRNKRMPFLKEAEILKPYLGVTLTDAEKDALASLSGDTRGGKVPQLHGPKRKGTPIVPLFLDDDLFSLIAARRIWLVHSYWGRRPHFGNNTLEVQRWMKENAVLVDSRWIDGVLLELYETKDKTDIENVAG